MKCVHVWAEVSVGVLEGDVPMGERGRVEAAILLLIQDVRAMPRNGVDLVRFATRVDDRVQLPVAQDGGGDPTCTVVEETVVARGLAGGEAGGRRAVSRGEKAMSRRHISLAVLCVVERRTAREGIVPSLSPSPSPNRTEQRKETPSVWASSLYPPGVAPQSPSPRRSSAGHCPVQTKAGFAGHV